MVTPVGCPARESEFQWRASHQYPHVTRPAGTPGLPAVSRARWDADEIRDDLQTYVAEQLGREDGALIIYDTGFVKQGHHSTGVQRQYSGTAWRTENCQIGVFAAYVTPAGRALVHRELYLPRSWTGDLDRCRAARVPAEREFATKGALAKAIVLRALASPLPIAWVTADAAYGQKGRFRQMLEPADVGYVLAVPKSQFSLAGPRIDHVFDQAPDQAWERLSCGPGAKGPKDVRLGSRATARGGRVRLPGRRTDLSSPGVGPSQREQTGRDRLLPRLRPLVADAADLVRVAGTRWAIEECFQAAKNECGLDQYEARRYVGWYRHITLAMLAHAFLAAVTAREAEKGGRQW